MRNIKLLTLLGIGLMVAPYAHAQAPDYGNPGYGDPGYQDPNYGNPGYPDEGYPQQGYGYSRLRISRATSGVPIRILPLLPLRMRTLRLLWTKLVLGRSFYWHRAVVGLA